MANFFFFFSYSWREKSLRIKIPHGSTSLEWINYYIDNKLYSYTFILPFESVEFVWQCEHFLCIFYYKSLTIIKNLFEPVPLWCINCLVTYTRWVFIAFFNMEFKCTFFTYFILYFYYNQMHLCISITPISTISLNI